MSGNESSLTNEQQAIINQKTAKIERLQTDITNLSKPLLGVDDSKDNSNSNSNSNKNNWTKHIATPGVLSVFQDNSSWNKLSLKPDNPLLKQQQTAYQDRLQEMNGSSWNKMKDVLTTANDILDGDDHVSENEISATKLNYRDVKTYGNMPMEDDIIVVNCNHCKRPILPSSFKEHLEKCGNKNEKEIKKNGNKDNSSNNTKKRIAAQTFFSDNDEDDDDEDDHMGTTKQKDKDTKDSTTIKKKKKLVKVNNATTNNDPTTTITTNSNNAASSSTTTTEDTTNSINTKRPLPNNTSNSSTTTTTTTNNDNSNSNALEKMDNKKKTKKEKSKSKSAKQKAPLDLDKQCGVIQIPNGTPCTRSLTCKSHSMGAKRAVAGRSQPYDVLLAAYQKKAIGRPQSGASGTGNNKNVKLKKSSSSSSSNTTPSTSNNNISGTNGNNAQSSTNITSSTSTTSTASTTTSTANNNNHNNNNNTNNTNTSNNHNLNNNEDYFDSDEEVENIMQALRSNHPTPLAQKPNFYVKRKRQCYRLRDILLEAITPKEKESSTSTSILSSSIQDNTTINNTIYNNKPTTPYSSTFPTSVSPSSSIHRQQSSTLLSPTNMNYSGIYMDGMSPTSPATSITSTYSIR
ncbi:unnamed protein product [Cunninghamella echinulata]